MEKHIHSEEHYWRPTFQNIAARRKDSICIFAGNGSSGKPQPAESGLYLGGTDQAEDEFNEAKYWDERCIGSAIIYLYNHVKENYLPAVV